MGDNNAPLSGGGVQGDMKYEEARLTTFNSWPANAKVEAWKMAKAGLLYTGQLEEVKCPFCGVSISDWQYGDQVMSKHRQANPSCPFIQNQSDNVPLIHTGAIPRTQTDGIRVPNIDIGVDIVDGGGGQGNEQRNQQNRNSVIVRGGRVEEDTDDVGMSRNLISVRSMSESDHVGDSEETGDEDHIASDEVRLLNRMKHESRRLATFQNWPKTFIRPSDLAKAGFFFLNRRDSCRCAFCGNFVGDWEPGDVPMNEHKKLFPLCGFVRGLPVGNIEVGEEGLEDVEGEVLEGVEEGVEVGEEAAGTGQGGNRRSPGHDEAGIREYQRLPNSGPENLPLPGDRRAEELGIISHHGPMHPSYATPDARLRSFKEWPPGLKVQPKELVDAGFYYIGLSDQVKCFYCDGGLRNWHSDDDPFVEHARWFDKCAFVRLQKGDEFIRKCIESKPPEEPQDIPGSSEGAGNQSAGNSASREVTEDDLGMAMSEALVRQVLSMGIDPSRVKMAIKKQLESYGYGFNNPEHLINAAFSVQRQQERRVTREHQNPSGAMLSGGGFGGSGSGAGQRRSFDEVTMRRWEEETYMSTEDEDEPPDVERWANPPPMSSFRSLPSGVRIAQPQQGQSPASSSSTNNNNTPTALPSAPLATNQSETPSGANSSQTSVISPRAPAAVEQPITMETENPPVVANEENPPNTSKSVDFNAKQLSLTSLEPKPSCSSSMSTESLEVEIARMKEQRTCKVCMDSEVGVVFLPCGHLICCVNCAPSLKDCAVCRTPIQGTVRTFMS